MAYRYPFKEEILSQTIMLALNRPIHAAQEILPRDIAAEEAKAQKEKEKKLKELEDVPKEEKRKWEREEKKRAKMEADLEPERLLRDEMAIAKARVAGTDLYMERMRGYVILEGKEDD